MTRQTTVSMLDRVEEIRTEEIADLQVELEAVRGKAEEFDDPWDIPDELENRYSQIQNRIDRLQGRANTLEHYAEEWGDDEFTIVELTAGSVSQIQDDVAEESKVTMQGEGTPKTGFARLRSLRQSVVDMPDSAPGLADLPDTVADWLFDCVDDFNTHGEVRLGNSSLRADLMKSES